MQIKERKLDQVDVLEVSGKIDINTSPELRKAFDTLIKNQRKRILLNFSQTSYIDSSGLATIVEMLQRLKRIGGKVRLASLCEKVNSLFEITKLDKLFNIFSDEQQALKDF